MTERVFVYGTLQPGQPRWPTLAYYADDLGPPIPACAAGRLFDTHRGWPAAVFTDNTTELVPGVIVAVHPDREQAALAHIDAIEGVDQGLFIRQIVHASGLVCWAYHWPADTRSFTPITAWPRRRAC